MSSLLLTPAALADDAVQDAFRGQSTNISYNLPQVSFVDAELDGGGAPKACVYNLSASATLERSAGSWSVREGASATASTTCARYPTVQLSISDTSTGLPTYTTSCGPRTAGNIGGPVACSASQIVNYNAPPRVTSEVTYEFTVSRGGVVKGCSAYTVKLVHGTQVSGSPQPC